MSVMQNLEKHVITEICPYFKTYLPSSNVYNVLDYNNKSIHNNWLYKRIKIQIKTETTEKVKEVACSNISYFLQPD